MEGTLSKLRSLQEIDREIQKLRKEMARWPSIVSEKEKDVEAIQNTLTEKNEVITQTRVDVESQESKLKSGEADIDKAKSNLLKIKTNREYEAVLHEIEGVKAENSMLEEKIIEGLEAIDSLMRDRREIEGEIRTAQAAVNDVQGQADRESQEIEEEISEIEETKKTCVAAIDPEVLAQYERIRNGRNGIAVVPVVGGVCQGCYMSLTSQEINMLLVTGDSLITCKNCQRILFIVE